MKAACARYGRLFAVMIGLSALRTNGLFMAAELRGWRVASRALVGCWAGDDTDVLSGKSA